MKKYINILLQSLIVLLLQFRLAGQAPACYSTIKDNSGITEVTGLPELQVASCDLVNTLPESFRPQFKVYSTSYYLHTGVTTPGFTPMLDQVVSEIGQSSAFYLLIARENAADGIFKNFKVVLKLPDTGQFSCLTESDRQFMATQLSEQANDAFAEKGKMAEYYPYAEKAVVDKLKRYIQKAIDCCASGNKMASATCTFCPDITVADRIKKYFEDTLFAVKIPVIAIQPIAKPAQKTTYQNVTVSDDPEFKFRDGDASGSIAEVIETVFNSDYFSADDYKAGFVSSNESACFNSPDLNTLKTQYKTAAEQQQSFVIWAHLWEDPADEAAQDYLYIAGKNPVWDNLQDAAVEGNVLSSLNNSFQFNINNTVFDNKFKQSATASLFPVVAKCYEKLETEIIPFTPNYLPPNSQIYCDNQLLSPSWFLSPAMQPVKIPADAIPDFSNIYWSTIFGNDERALVRFTTQTEHWHGCFHPVRVNDQKVYDRFSGYYCIYTKGVGKYIALDLSQPLPNVFDVLIQTTYSGGERELEYKSYYPPTNRVPEAFATGDLVKVFSEAEGLKPYEGTLINPEPYNVVPNSYATVDELIAALTDARYYPAHQGLILKVLRADFKYEFYKVDRKSVDNISEYSQWYRFNCGTGLWTKMAISPFEVSDPAKGKYWLLFYANVEQAQTLLDVAGMIPVIGEVFDLVNGVVYIVKGEYGMAALSCLSAIPLIDAGIKGAKLKKFATANVVNGIPAYAGQTNKIAEAVSRLADEGQEIKKMTFFKACALANKSEAVAATPNLEQLKDCMVELPLDLLRDKSKSIYSTISEDDWAAYIDDIRKEASSGNTAFAEAVAKSVKAAPNNGPDLFHAWNYAKKAGQTLDLNQLKKLGEDLEAVPELAKKFQNDPDLIKAWKVISDRNLSAAWRRSQTYLIAFKNVVNDANLEHHILAGHPSYRSDNTIEGIRGVHSKEAVTVTPTQTVFNQGDVRIKPGTQTPPNPGPNDIYTAEPEIYGLNKSTTPPVEEWRKKMGGGGVSTFFPDSWTKEQIQNEIAFVRKQIKAGHPKQPGGWYEAWNSDGSFKIGMYIQNDNLQDLEAVIGSAFPIL